MNKLYNYFINSFLSPLLNDSEITDISYNGEAIFFQSNKKRRVKANILVSEEQVNDFIRQIANLSENLFSLASPILDISINEFRFNAVHNSIGRKKHEKCHTFCIRRNSNEINIKDIKDNLPIEIDDLLTKLVCLKKTILICGETGSGKTELQKYLISKCPNNSRIVIIDNVQELGVVSLENLDTTYWQTTDKVALPLLIQNALRFNPDWIIVAEARGKEIEPLLQSVLSGHPLIATIHAKNLSLLPIRIANMLLAYSNMRGEISDILPSVYSALNIGIHLSVKIVNGYVTRFIDEIGEYTSKNKYHVIYRFGQKSIIPSKLSAELRRELNLKEV